MSTAEVINLVDYRDNKMSNSKQGHFDIYRSLLEADWATDTCKLACWVRLIGKASYKDITVNFNNKEWKLSRGQLVIRITDLASKLRDRDGKPMSRDSVDRILKFFKSKSMITIDGTRFGTVITILNYSKYNNVATASMSASISANNEASNTNTLSDDAANISETNTATHEQEVNNKNNKHMSSGDDSPMPKNKNSIDYDLIMKAYNDAVEGEEFKTITTVNAKRKIAIKKLISEMPTKSVDGLINYFYDFAEKAPDWTRGKTSLNFTAHFDYIVRIDTYTRFIEGSL